MKGILGPQRTPAWVEQLVHPLRSLPVSKMVSKTLNTLFSQGLRGFQHPYPSLPFSFIRNLGPQAQPNGLTPPRMAGALGSTCSSWSSHCNKTRFTTRDSRTAWYGSHQLHMAAIQSMQAVNMSCTICIEHTPASKVRQNHNYNQALATWR